MSGFELPKWLNIKMRISSIVSLSVRPMFFLAKSIGRSALGSFSPSLLHPVYDQIIYLKLGLQIYIFLNKFEEVAFLVFFCKVIFNVYSVA